MTVSFNTKLLRKAQVLIEETLKRWHFDATHVTQGELPANVLPVGGDTGNGFTPTAHVHAGYASEDHTHPAEEAIYDARKIWGRDIVNVTAPTDGQALVYDASLDDWVYRNVATGTADDGDPTGGGTGTYLGNEVWGALHNDQDGAGWFNVEPNVLTAIPLPHGTLQNMARDPIDNTRLVVTISGRYTVIASVAWQQNITGGMRHVAIGHNGVRRKSTTTRPVDGDVTYGGRTMMQAVTIGRFVVGDYFQVLATHNADVPIGIDIEFYSVSLLAERLTSLEDYMTDDLTGSFVIDDVTGGFIISG